MITKIISGGQTGADRAGLNVAIELGIEHGGWAPKGFFAEDGRIPSCYKLKEYPVDGYPARTEQNILDSDGTVVFTYGRPAPDSGSELTLKLARRHKIPVLHIDLHKPPADSAKKLIEWFRKHEIKTLNVAGSRSSDNRTVVSVGHQTRLILKAAILVYHHIIADRLPRPQPPQEEHAN